MQTYVSTCYVWLGVTNANNGISTRATKFVHIFRVLIQPRIAYITLEDLFITTIRCNLSIVTHGKSFQGIQSEGIWLSNVQQYLINALLLGARTIKCTQKNVPVY